MNANPEGQKRGRGKPSKPPEEHAKTAKISLPPDLWEEFQIQGRSKWVQQQLRLARQARLAHPTK